VDYVDPSRATTISELIEKKDKLDVEDMQRIQYDVSVWSARSMVPLILEDLEGADDKALIEAARILKEWKASGYNADIDSRGTCVFIVFRDEWPRAVFADEMGKIITRGAGQAGLFSAALEKIIDDPSSPWFDDKNTKKAEDRKDIVRKVMKETMKFLRKRLGRNSDKWRWGDLSTITISTAFFAIPGLTKKESRGPYPLPGTGETVAAAGQIYLGPLGYKGFVGPSTRIIVDFRDPRRAYFNTTAGMADNEDGGRYDNLMSAWLEGRYLVMSMDEDEYREGMMGELLLLP